jgi:hypothetical protein
MEHSRIHLFGTLKKYLAGWRFATDADVNLAFATRWEKCLNVNGNYMEV